MHSRQSLPLGRCWRTPSLSSKRGPAKYTPLGQLEPGAREDGGEELVAHDGLGRVGGQLEHVEARAGGRQLVVPGDAHAVQGEGRLQPAEAQGWGAGAAVGTSWREAQVSGRQGAQGQFEGRMGDSMD